MKRLYRSQSQRMLAGVCGGLAEFFDLDVTVIRLITAFLIFISGILPGAFFYFIAALIIPSE